MKLMATWPRSVEACSKAQEPHRITIFLNDLAGATAFILGKREMRMKNKE